MTAPEGGFYSTQDADSEGEEGKFFLWTPAEIGAVLPPGDAALFMRYYDVTQQGNFEGKNILHVVDDSVGVSSPPPGRDKSAPTEESQATPGQHRSPRSPGRDKSAPTEESPTGDTRAQLQRSRE